MLNLINRFLVKVGLRRPAEQILQPWYCNSHELHFNRGNGRSLCIRWCDVEQVTWSEPDFGWFHHEPYWLMQVAGVRLRVDHKKELLRAFAKRLPGFDEKTIERARAIGHFNNPNAMGYLNCWQRTGQN